MNQESLRPNIDLKNTTAIISPAGNQLFAEGVILRKVSKFVAGTAEDGIMPIPVFYDVKTGEILIDTLPKDLRSEFVTEEDEE
jgi:hypothetical protein|tara:strand:+ start:2739 stop:2987 length:249 start_codon:yes stop_codon:yes gene_type:complete